MRCILSLVTLGALVLLGDQSWARRDALTAEQKSQLERIDRVLVDVIVLSDNIAFRITGSMEDASEVVQDAFFSAHRNLKNFEQKSRFSTWLYSITVNTAKNRLNQNLTRKTHEPHSSDDPPHANSNTKRLEPASDDPSALDLLLKKDRQKSVQECLNRLEQDFGEVIVLRDIQGFAYTEIAELLALAEGTVKSGYIGRGMLSETA